MRPSDLCPLLALLTAPACFYAPTGSPGTTGPAAPVSTTGSTGGPDTTTGSTTREAVTEPTAGSSSTGTSTTGTSSTGDSTSTSTTDGTTDTSTTGSSTGDTSTGNSSSSETTMSGPMCGDNIAEGDEVCDGTDVNKMTCVKLLPDKWGGGVLACNGSCSSYDDDDCCIGQGMKCNTANGAEECCGGLDCMTDPLLNMRCM